MYLEEYYLDFLNEHKYQYILYLFTLLYIPLSKVGIPHFYGKLIGNINDKKIESAFNVLIALILLWFLTEAIHSYSNIAHSKFMPKFVEFFRIRLIDNILESYKTSFEDLQIGDTIAKIIKSPWIIDYLFEVLENIAFNNILVILSSFIYLFFYNKILGFIYFFSMLSVVAIIYCFVDECTPAVEISEDIFDRAHEEIEDALSNLISIYTSNKIEHEKARINVLSKYVNNTQRSMLKCFGKYRLKLTAVFVIVFAILNIFSFTLFVKSSIDLATLSAIIIINYSLLSSFMSMYYQSRNIIEVKGRIELFIKYLNKLPKKNDFGTKKILNSEAVKIEVRDVTFSYNPGKYILNNVSLTIKPGENIALVGQIGSGKSTLAKLLTRLFDYDSGSILFNGTEIRSLSVKNLRKHVRYIPQHPKLFNRTLYENIIYAVKEEVDEKYILEIIKMLNMPDIYKIFSQQMHNNVGKNGSKLSGGQRQVVWLLRAILSKPAIIILDEPTASMDRKSKLEVTKLVKKLGEKSTIILITHDDILLDYVDRKIEFKDGKVISN